MSESSYEKLVKNEDFISAVALAIAKSPKIQVLILESIIKNVATKDDLRDLRHYVDVRISDLNKRIDILETSINARIDSLDKRIDSLDKRISLLQWGSLLGFSMVSVFLGILAYVIALHP